MVMRPNATGWGIAVFFLLGGIAFWVVTPEIWLGQIWVAVALGLGLLYLFRNRGANAKDRLKQEGAAGVAHILELTQTGVQVNDQPMVRLKLRVEASGIAPFEIEKREVVPLVALGSLSSGRPLTVYVDRADHSNVVIDWGMTMAPTTISHEGGAPVDLNANPQARQAVLEVLRRHGIDAQGQIDLRSNPAARAEVLEALRAHGSPVDGSAPGSAGAKQEETTLDRLQQLMELKNAQVITDEEFVAQKKRILEDV